MMRRSLDCYFSRHATVNNTGQIFIRSFPPESRPNREICSHSLGREGNNSCNTFPAAKTTLLFLLRISLSASHFSNGKAHVSFVTRLRAHHGPGRSDSERARAHKFLTDSSSRVDCSLIKTLIVVTRKLFFHCFFRAIMVISDENAQIYQHQ